MLVIAKPLSNFSTTIDGLRFERLCRTKVIVKRLEQDWINANEHTDSMKKAEDLSNTKGI